MSWANTFEVEWVNGRLQVCVWETNTGLERLAAMFDLLPAEAEELLHLLDDAIIDGRLLSDPRTYGPDRDDERSGNEQS